MKNDFPKRLIPIFSHMAENIRDEFLINCKPALLDRVAEIRVQGRRLTQADYDGLFTDHGLNSYEREVVNGNLDDAAFETLLGRIRENCSQPYHSTYRPCSSYDEAAIHYFIPLMLKRIRELAAENEELRKRVLPVFSGG